MRQFELILFWGKDLINFLKRSHTGAGERIEIAHIDEKITRAAIMGFTSIFKQLALTLRIQPAAETEHGHRHISLHLFGRDSQIAIHSLLLASKRFRYCIITRLVQERCYATRAPHILRPHNHARYSALAHITTDLFFQPWLLLSARVQSRSSAS